MRRQKPWAGRIKRLGARLPERSLLGRAEGSIVMEAAIVLPLILLALTSFVLVISLCTAQMALHSAAAQTARSMASHMYPAELAQQGIASGLTGALPSLPTPVPLPEWGEVAAEAAEWLPDPAGELASSALRGDWGPLVDMAATELGRGIVEPLARRFVVDSVLDPKRIKLARLTLPDLKTKETAYLIVALQYEFPVKIPLLGKSIVLREQAFERVWISDAAAASYGSKIGEGSDIMPLLQIVSISPSPLRPGHKATVLVRTEPGISVSLGVMYKSGASKAKHLGEATADGNGFASWTWHVSGNTTPGIWQLTVQAQSNGGEASVSKHFVVEKRDRSESVTAASIK
ncbi:pilus assembly protein [Paenibacillus sp. LHD-117]|uniref:TadE family protein n=1 Tax=Paenibacillus sp. LHD-117 TaxID=3071412 RepID=UPI0027DEB236|nr:pilus assembly protein [Paenibacillus sp. LHD-117]MDQ6420327.1 pilus assembly protein [Paenibacillus sp. LHD-117]